MIFMIMLLVLTYKQILTGRFKDVSDIKDRGVMVGFPRFQPGAFEQNLELVRQVEAVAKAKGCTSAQLAIAWVRKYSNRPGLPTIIPIPGATAASRVRENAELVEITDEEFSALNNIVFSFKTAGARYPDFVPMNS